MSSEERRRIIRYRPEVDGLRMLAVTLVITHHLGWSLIPGGYIGVDVFFVISGYLITKIIDKEICDGAFTFSGFYRRRILRLAPAYFTVIGATTVFSYLFMLPAELVNYSRSTIYSTFFIANYYMWKEAGGYFGGNSGVVPLLHLWSLAVEEQFYIFWPTALLILRKTAKPRWLFSLIFMLLLVAGICISEWGALKYPAAAYYLLPTRFFELLVGSALTFLPRINLNTWKHNIGGITGLYLIAYPAVTYTKERYFPGFSAAIPCAGAAMLILFLEKGFVGKVFSFRPIVYCGRISYPAYLWHWPIIAFLNLNSVQITLEVAIIVVFTTFLLSLLTHELIENPSKNFRGQRFSKILIFWFIAPAFCMYLFAVFTFRSYGFPQRFSEEINKKSNAILSYTHHWRGRCNEGSIERPLPENDCILGVSDRNVDFLLIGDSHANHFTGMLDHMARNGRSSVSNGN